VGNWDPREGFGSWNYYSQGPGQAFVNQKNPYAGLVGRAQGLYDETADWRKKMPNYGEYKSPDWDDPAVRGKMNSWRTMMQGGMQSAAAPIARQMANARANVRGGLRVGGGSDPYAEYLKGAIGDIAGQSSSLMREGYGNVVSGNKWNYGLARDQYGDYRSGMSDRISSFNTLASTQQQQEAWNRMKDEALRSAWLTQGEQNMGAKDWGTKYSELMGQIERQKAGQSDQFDLDQRLKMLTSGGQTGGTMSDAELQNWLYLQMRGKMPIITPKGTSENLTPGWQGR